MSDDKPVTIAEPVTVVDTGPSVPVKPPGTSRAMRRQKSRRITMNDMRKWQANGIMSRLFAPKEKKDE